MSARTRFLRGTRPRADTWVYPYAREYSGANGNLCGKRTLSQRGGTEPAPYEGSGQASGVRLGSGGAWSPRPTGATLVVRSKRADVGIGPYGEKGKPTQPPRPAAHSGASAARMGGRGGIAAEIILKGAINIEQSLSHGLWPCQLPLHKGAFGDGGCGLPRRPCGPPRNDNGFLSFRGQCAHWSWESVLFTMDGGVGRPTKDEGNGTPSRRALRKAQLITRASRRAAKRPRPRPRGMGGNCSRDYPQRGHQRRTIPQSRPLAVPAPFAQGSLWGRGMRIAASALRASSQ